MFRIRFVVVVHVEVVVVSGDNESSVCQKILLKKRKEIKS